MSETDSLQTVTFPQWKQANTALTNLVFSYNLVLDTGEALPSGITSTTSAEGILRVTVDPLSLQDGTYIVEVRPMLDQTSIPTLSLLIGQTYTYSVTKLSATPSTAQEDSSESSVDILSSESDHELFTGANIDAAVNFEEELPSVIYITLGERSEWSLPAIIDTRVVDSLFGAETLS